jgi:hypothetical protein
MQEPLGSDEFRFLRHRNWLARDCTGMNVEAGSLLVELAQAE